MKERTTLLLSALESETTSMDTLENPFTPQYEAFGWLDDDDNAVLCPDEERLEQRFALAVTYFALNGREWTNCQADLDDDSDIGDCVMENGTSTTSRWLSETSECEWFGVLCDDSGRITKLTLKNNNLAGSLPNEVFASLPWLSGLSLDRNKNITGTIPSVMLFQNLTYIELDDNALTGSLPDALFSLATLKAIDLKGNQLTGTLSSEIENLAELMVLQLDQNQLEGSLPSDALASLSSMRK